MSHHRPASSAKGYHRCSLDFSGFGFGFSVLCGCGGVFSIRLRTSSSLFGSVSFMLEPRVVEGIVIHNLPDDLASGIGRVIVAYGRIEHNLSSIASLLLQLNKAEMRIALRMPRAADRMEMVLDLFAIKGITIKDLDTNSLKNEISEVSTKRDWLAHGLWLQHPETGEIFLRVSRGNWDKSETEGHKVSRPIFPQSKPFSASDCADILKRIEAILAEIDRLGSAVDHALKTWPERFREQAPLVNPLGHRKPIESKSKPQYQRKPSAE
jgi:hypothetical protein